MYAITGLTGRVGGDRIGNDTQRRLRRWLGLDEHRELRLAARPFEIHHQRPRDIADELGAVVLFHQCHRQVDARRHARRGEHIAVADEDRVGLNAYIGERARE